MAAEEETKKISYPLDLGSYELHHQIRGGVTSKVFKVACLPMKAACLPKKSVFVVMKAINIDRSNEILDEVCREATTMALLSHPNILTAHCSFSVDGYLMVVMPFMAAGSLRYIITNSYPNGLSEKSIAVVLKEILQALVYLHDQDLRHRDIKAGNILVDSDGSVKLADYGISASIYEPYSSLNNVVGSLYWMAPEVVRLGYGIKADIWSFGVTAMELAHGRPPLSHPPLSKSLKKRITKRFKLSSYSENKREKKKFSKNFKEMVASCLSQDPTKRPSAEKLLKHPFFKNCRKSHDYILKNVLQGLPIPVTEELIEEDFDGSLSPSSPSSTLSPVKHQRISGWKFNKEILEFDPVFLTDNCIQFGGESIITGHIEEKSDTTTGEEKSSATYGTQIFFLTSLAFLAAWIFTRKR